ncbi:MAG: tetratricopeptide repeat protein [Tannerellaceae bacterium]|jgi:tetratricopeptide (TPR) repeat protein|nr:tetratricopeptide repeat protein [Tannerellaceae bacterium]
MRKAIHKAICAAALLLFCCTTPGKAQSGEWQELLVHRQYAEIIARAESLGADRSDDYGKMYALALAYEGMLKHREALQYFRICFEADSTRTDLLNALARTEAALGRTAEAERYYRKTLATDSADFYAAYQLARLYLQQEMIPKALEAYESLLGRDPANPVLLSAAGDCYTRLGELPRAALCYFQAYGANRDNALQAGALINTLLRMGGEAAKSALEICDTALHYNPRSLLLRRSKAMTLFVNKKYAEADTLYSTLLAEGDSLPVTVAYGGFSRYYAGQYMRAVDLLEPAYRKDSTSVDAALILGSALGKTYDRQRAYTLFDRAEKLMQPDSSKVRLLKLFRAETLRRDARNDESAALYYEIWMETPHIDILKTLADLYAAPSVSACRSENEKRRTLFCHTLYAQEQLKYTKDAEPLARTLHLLRSFREDAFFRSLTELPMTSPDGKRSALTVHRLQELISRGNLLVREQ